MNETDSLADDVVAEHYYYAFHRAYGDLIALLRSAGLDLTAAQNCSDFRDISEVARRNGFRLRVTVEPIPQSPKPRVQQGDEPLGTFVPL